eukprot:CAMPEP_0170648692 /NCGR_PEP_ID=MMETSP0224-20130122/44869_1 /TAXON_ID=285029 /ORGANISM="Togula jolla, Strain CCCM 725" /LENGTH=412 /DNA_ID=CAMNT_0010980233 /DNA_START=47 /DNA_END=1282 /DNA_ORIENTATION=+
MAVPGAEEASSRINHACGQLLAAANASHSQWKDQALQATYARLQLQLDAARAELQSVSSPEETSLARPSLAEGRPGNWRVRQLWSSKEQMESILALSYMVGRDGVAACASGSEDGTVVVQNISEDDGTRRFIGFIAGTSPFTATSFIDAPGISEGWLVAVGALEVSVSLVNSRHSTARHRISMRDRPIVAMSTSVPPAATGLLAVAAGRTVALWDLMSQDPLTPVRSEMLSDAVLDVKLPAPSLLATLSASVQRAEPGRWITMWDLRERRSTCCVRALVDARTLDVGTFDAVAADAQGKSVVLAVAAGRSVEIWDLRHRLRPLQRSDALPVATDQTRASSCTLDPTGRHVAVSCGGPNCSEAVLIGDFGLAFNEVSASSGLADALLWLPPEAAGAQLRPGEHGALLFGCHDG